MKISTPFSVVKAAGVVWAITAPLLWLGAVLSKMETIERYYVQLSIASFVGIIAISSAIGAFAGRSWARGTLLLLSLAAATFMLSSAYSLYRAQTVLPSLSGVHIFPSIAGGIFLALAALLLFTENIPTQPT